MKGMSFICTQTLVWPAGGTAGSSWGGALVAACSVLPPLLLLAKFVVPFCQLPHLNPRSLSYCILLCCQAALPMGKEAEYQVLLLWVQGKKAQWPK